MQDVLGESLIKSKKIRVRKTRMIAILLVLSLVVSLDVFWWLRQPGLTLAGDADCEIVEHTHDEECLNGDTPCNLVEHVHDISCYSDDKADVETQLDWQRLFANYPYTGNLRSDLVGIAKTQVGYTESKENFQVGSDGIRRGYNRYGAWYGTPYTDWSALFVSFCLHYAGADSSATPGNTGANSMAEAWKKLGKYAAVGEYAPISGDLVFFKNNTVGIVTDINAFTFCVIRGDVDGVVKSGAILLTDASIAGWGVTVGTSNVNESPNYEKIYDITNGPAVFIFEGIAAPKPTPTQTRLYSIRASRNITNIVKYLTGNGGNYFFTLYDTNNQELPKDANGHYIAVANTGYKLTVGFTSPNGFAPGRYQYQIPNGLMIDGGEGEFVLSDGTNVGSWVVTDTGLITIDFNENINSRTDITISATMGIHFSEQEEPIDFDGLITVKVNPPVAQQYPTVLTKWGSQNKETGKINWTVKIEGYADSQIPGNILTDKAGLGQWSKPHSYTSSDMEGGLTFGVSDPKGDWHTWHVTTDDPHLIWDENGWSYKIPQTVTCNYCGELELGNDGWTYMVNYTSTPQKLDTPGTFGYENEATIDGKTTWGWVDFTHVETDADIVKHGSFHEDADGGYFLWEIQASIPGMKDGEKPVYLWQIQDYMRIKNQTNNIVGYIDNTAHLAEVWATRGTQTVLVPHVDNATANDDFAWFIQWSTDNNGIYYHRALTPLCRCRCTEDNCVYWNSQAQRCDSQHWIGSHPSGFCICWTEKSDTLMTFVYKTDDMAVLNSFGNLGYSIENEVLLQNHITFPDKDPQSSTLADSQAKVPIPGLFKKELTHDFNGYTAKYKITVNEGKLALTDGSPLTIHDVMTETLVYIGGSLVITSEDANGNVTTLKQDEDYTITYDGTGSKTDANGKPVHVLDIVILRPQPVTYILDYDATLVIPSGVTEAIKYTNSATISLWGQQISDTTVEKVYADINIVAKSYKVEIFKNCAVSGAPLMGATFGLYNEQGGLIASAVTDADGKIVFQTNVTEGIILREHVPYYIQEISAPAGYRLDDTKFWFCFCNQTEDTCQDCTRILAGKDARRIPFEQVGKVHAVNHPLNYDLPATGGSGVYPLILVSVMFIITPLVYRFTLRRKRERRLGG